MEQVDSLTEEQASMYRRIRRDHMSHHLFEELTGISSLYREGDLKGDLKGDLLTDLEVDLALRDAHTKYLAENEGAQVSERSKIRSGILPADLGKAVLEYTEAIQNRSQFLNGLNGTSTQDFEVSVLKAFRNLCNEMVKLR